jgi:hypothetical protein
MNANTEGVYFGFQGLPEQLLARERPLASHEGPVLPVFSCDKRLLAGWGVSR